MARARNMQALTNDIVREWPGTTVWGKGDKAHESSRSDHNEDDTPGSRPEQTDADNDPEHRAIDVAKLGPMTMDRLHVLRQRLTDRPANQRRMRYVILEQTIWRARDGWKPDEYGGEYHGHLHVSGDAADDENGSAWDIRGLTEQPNPVKGDEDMKMIIGTLKGRATAWSGLRGLVPLHAHSHGQAVSALLAAGAVSQTFDTAEALVEALGTYASGDVAGAVADVNRAG
jgi:hypothetical protein